MKLKSSEKAGGNQMGQYLVCARTGSWRRIGFLENEVHEIRGHSAHGLNASNKGKDKETCNGHGRGRDSRKWSEQA
jgi:hypothetical protein